MKRNFREPKNRYKNGAKNDRQKIATMKSTQSLENKGDFRGGKVKKTPKLTQDTAKIRARGDSNSA